MADKRVWEGEDYGAFRERVFGTPYMVWHDGARAHGLYNLSDEEKAHTERMLTEGVKQGDYAAIVGWEAYDTERAVEVLKPVVQTAKDVELIGELVAFLEKYDTKATKKDKQARINLLTSAIERSGSYASLGTLMKAGGVPTKKIVNALLDRVENGGDYLIRYHAANSLLQIAGKKREISEHKKLFGLIISRLEDQKEMPDQEEDLERYRKAADMLRGMVQRRWPFLKLGRALKSALWSNKK